MREVKEGIVKKDKEKYLLNIGQWFKPTKDILQSMVGGNNKIEID